jgi:hypothetical protein
MASCKLSAFIKYRQLSTSNSFLWRHQFEFLIKILRHCIFHKFLNLSIRNKKVNYTRFCPETLHLTPASIVLFSEGSIRSVSHESWDSLQCWQQPACSILSQSTPYQVFRTVSALQGCRQYLCMHYPPLPCISFS